MIIYSTFSRVEVKEVKEVEYMQNLNIYKIKI